MSVGLVLFLTAIAIVTVVGICALTVYLEREFPSEKFDERQKIARGNAHRFSWWIGMAYYFGLMVYFVFHVGKNEWVLQPFLLLTIGILLQLQSFHIYCLMTHSALPLGEKPIPTIISNLVLGCMYLVQFFAYPVPDNVGYAGADSMNLFRLLISADFFCLAILHLIAFIRDRKE